MTQSDRQVAPPKLLGNLFKWLRIFFILYIISEVVLAIGNLMILRMGSLMFGPSQPFTLGDGIQAIGGLMLLASYVVCIVLFCVFPFVQQRTFTFSVQNTLINLRVGPLGGTLFPLPIFGNLTAS